jgi:hypothetical protein
MEWRRQRIRTNEQQAPEGVWILELLLPHTDWRNNRHRHYQKTSVPAVLTLNSHRLVVCLTDHRNDRSFHPLLCSMRAARGQRQPSQTTMVGQRSLHQPSFSHLEGGSNVAQSLTTLCGSKKQHLVQPTAVARPPCSDHVLSRCDRHNLVRSPLTTWQASYSLPTFAAFLASVSTDSICSGLESRLRGPTVRVAVSSGRGQSARVCTRPDSRLERLRS